METVERIAWNIGIACGIGSVTAFTLAVMIPSSVRLDGGWQLMLVAALVTLPPMVALLWPGMLLRRSKGQPDGDKSEPPSQRRHHSYVFASQTPKRRRKVVA